MAMKRLASAVAAWAVLCGPAWAQPAPKARFDRAQELERQVHATAAPGAAQFRSAMQAYEAVVRRYPSSGYCDDALWRAAELGAEAFSAHGQEVDLEAAKRYLRWLVREYPHSKYVKDVPQRMARLDAPKRQSAPASGALVPERATPASAEPPRVPPPAPAASPQSAAAPPDRPADPNLLRTLRGVTRAIVSDV